MLKTILQVLKNHILFSISPSISTPGLRLIMPLYFCCSRIYLEFFSNIRTRIICKTYRHETITAPNVLLVL